MCREDVGPAIGMLNHYRSAVFVEIGDEEADSEEPPRELTRTGGGVAATQFIWGPDAGPLPRGPLERQDAGSYGRLPGTPARALGDDGLGSPVSRLPGPPVRWAHTSEAALPPSPSLNKYESCSTLLLPEDEAEHAVPPRSRAGRDVECPQLPALPTHSDFPLLAVVAECSPAGPVTCHAAGANEAACRRTGASTPGPARSSAPAAASAAPKKAGSAVEGLKMMGFVPKACTSHGKEAAAVAAPVIVKQRRTLKYYPPPDEDIDAVKVDVIDQDCEMLIIRREPSPPPDNKNGGGGYGSSKLSR